MAYAEKRGKGPRPWRVKYKVPGGEASQSGFETKQAALGWGRDQEARVRADTWTDPGASEITVSEWIDRWKTMQDVGPSTNANRDCDQHARTDTGARGDGHAGADTDAE